MYPFFYYIIILGKLYSSIGSEFMKEEYLSSLDSSLEQLQNEINRLNVLLDATKYIRQEDVNRIAINISHRIKFKFFPDFNVLKAFFKYKKSYRTQSYELINKKNNIKELVNKANGEFLFKLREKFIDNCLPVEGKSLDFDQIDSIVREDRNVLIVAGAGTGKTTTIIGRVKYLIKCLGVDPCKILLLSFTNASAEEMKDRVEKEVNTKVDTFTFHKLGLDIIKKSLNKNLNVYDGKLANFIENELEKNIKNEEYLSKVIYLLAHIKYLDRDEFDFSTEEEYQEFLLYNSPITLKGEEVKSYGELEIANYLYKNNINYIYEEKYKIDTTTSDYKEYRPDFYLPDYNIYIEYFGIDRGGSVAPYFKGKDGKSASQIYNESIEWKRQTHKENNTIMIELFYYQNKEHTLLDNLERELKKYDVDIKRKDVIELWNEIQNRNNEVLNEISKMLETIINLIKSNNYCFEKFKTIALSENITNGMIIDILEPIYQAYNNYLNENNYIDFNDMINQASELVLNNSYIHDYSYVIVDEYQDISYARYNLLKSLRTQKEYKLFCVGDDFQSIYRFSGSDINLFVDFEKYWGPSYIGKIEKTYRYTKELADISGRFVMKNPRQMIKNLSGLEAERYPLSEVVAYNEKYLVDFLGNKLQELNENSTVFLIGRYSFDINLIRNNINFSIRYNNSTKMTEVNFHKRPDLKITFLTAHRSKGLQADYAIIMNNRNRGLGFPSKIQDLPIINCLLSVADEYPYSEERRLFYVAITRSKIKTIFLVLEDNKSMFIKELENMCGDNLQRERFECPKCGHRLTRKNGKYGIFIGCTNYPECNYTRK